HRPLGPGPVAAEEGARRPRAALLRAAVGGRDRRGPRHLRRHREVPDQPGPGRAPRAHAGPPEPRNPRGGAMSDLDDELTRTLHRHAENLPGGPGAPLAFDDVRGKATSI